jgi:prepilin-type N-terminal cleavage/methylation domain-containing protein
MASSRCSSSSPRRGFTLIELLVVIAIIAILSVVVILTLNPAELLRQSRDANRVSDMATINGALGIYAEDVGGSMGTPSTTYISILDPTATSTAGDQCQGLRLPAQSTSSGWIYQCAASSSYRNVNGTGWVPLNFTSISSGAAIGTLPQDPINQTSSNLFYTYTTDGNTYEATAVMESQKYRAQLNANPPQTLYPGIDAVGTNLALSGLWNPTGLVGYWNFEEGAGSSTVDQSGNGNAGVWSGSTPYYTSGRVGSYAGQFNGTDDVVTVSSSNTLNITQAVTIAGWVYWRGMPDTAIHRIVDKNTKNYTLAIYGSNNATNPDKLIFAINNFTIGAYATFPVSTNNWYYVVGTYDGTAARLYINGSFNSQGAGIANIQTSALPLTIGWAGTGINFNGLIDDVRIYNRALSAAEIQALYNAEK